MCLVNVLTGDPFYVKYYPDEYAYFQPKLDVPTKAALERLMQLKEAHGLILSAGLTLLFSNVEIRTLEELVSTVEDGKDLKLAFEKSQYYSEEGWAMYESIRPEVITIFRFLSDVGFEEHWEQNVRPKVEARLSTLKREISRYDVVKGVEWGLGSPMPSNEITIYLLYYTQPHGIKITGTRFLTDVAYGIETVVNNAIHEMMHPPYDYSGDRELRAALETLKKDAFMMDRFENHDPAYGYNTFDGYVEENVVDALQRVISDRMAPNLSSSVREFKEADGGMHVLAVALYSLMKEEHFNEKGERVRDFLIRMIASRKLGPGQIEARYNGV